MADLKGRLLSLRHYLATSGDPLPQATRKAKRAFDTFELRLPSSLVVPLGYGAQAVREVQHNAMRIFVCQPAFRALCKECGPNLRTGACVHEVRGDGDLIVGSNVWIDGLCSISFASSYSERPTLVIGDNTGIGHHTAFAVGKRITIGKNVIISGSTILADSSGHPTDPVKRRLHQPASPEDVRPITIGDDAWIGKSCIIFPGVRIGEAAIISAGSVVHRHVPPFGVVAGNPAQLMFRLPRPAQDAAEKADIAARAAAAAGTPSA